MMWSTFMCLKYNDDDGVDEVTMWIAKKQLLTKGNLLILEY